MKRILASLLLLLALCPFSGFAQQKASTTLTLVVTAPVTITTSTLPACTVGVVCTFTVSATGGTAPYTYTFLNGVSLGGMAINKTTGVFTWTPTAAQVGNAAQSFQATDSKGLIGTRQFTVTVKASTTTPLTIPSQTLPAGVVGTPYSASLVTSGGVAPITWAITSGALPSGLTFSTAGIFGGTSTAATSVGGTALTLTATDSSGAVASLNLIFMASAATSHSVDLTWVNSPTPGVTGVNVLKNGTQINTTPVSTQPFVDTAVVAGTNPCYALTAVGPNGSQSVATAQVCAMIPTP